MAMNTHAETGELLKPEDVAKRLGVSKRQIYLLIDAGELPPPMKVGHMNRWSTTDIAGYISRLSAKRESLCFDTA